MTSQTTEAKILAAAEAEFISKGYAGARTIAIAQSAGVTHAMLHYYFRSKEGLFRRVVESKIALIRDMMLGFIDDPDTPLFAKIEAAISHHLDFLAANPLLPRFLINEICTDEARMAAVEEIIRANLSRVISSLRQQIDEGAAKGECRRVDARMLIIDILSLNAFPVMAAPLVNLVWAGGDGGEAFLARRKRETTDLIMRKLKV